MVPMSMLINSWHSMPFSTPHNSPAKLLYDTTVMIQLEMFKHATSKGQSEAAALKRTHQNEIF